jgi:hypothetical protein
VKGQRGRKIGSCPNDNAKSLRSRTLAWEFLLLRIPYSRRILNASENGLFFVCALCCVVEGGGPVLTWVSYCSAEPTRFTEANRKGMCLLGNQTIVCNIPLESFSMDVMQGCCIHSAMAVVGIDTTPQLYGKPSYPIIRRSQIFERGRAAPIIQGYGHGARWNPHPPRSMGWGNVSPNGWTSTGAKDPTGRCREQASINDWISGGYIAGHIEVPKIIRVRYLR